MVCTGEKDAPGMDHVDTMLERDADNIVLCEICAYGGEALADLIRLIGLWLVEEPGGGAKKRRAAREDAIVCEARGEDVPSGDVRITCPRRRK